MVLAGIRAEVLGLERIADHAAILGEPVEGCAMETKSSRVANKVPLMSFAPATDVEEYAGEGMALREWLRCRQIRHNGVQRIGRG